MSRKTAEVTIGHKHVELVELTVSDSMKVDRYLQFDENGAPNPVVMSKVYALAAVRRVNGEYMEPTADQVQWLRVCSHFGAFEAYQLIGAYQSAFGGAESPEARMARARRIALEMTADDHNFEDKRGELVEALTTKPVDVAAAGEVLKNE